jgi:hypothetical protein
MIQKKNIQCVIEKSRDDDTASAPAKPIPAESYLASV